MYVIYTALVWTALLLVFAPVALVRRITRGVPINVRARLGRGTAGGGRGPAGWVHAVSVGEAIAAAPLVEGLRRLHPELPLVITTVTSTGACVKNTRILTEQRTFTVTTPPTGGGAACPASPQTRTRNEACTVTAPPSTECANVPADRKLTLTGAISRLRSINPKAECTDLPGAKWWVWVDTPAGEYRICAGTPPGGYAPTQGDTVTLTVCRP